MTQLRKAVLTGCLRYSAWYSERCGHDARAIQAYLGHLFLELDIFRTS